MFGVLREIKEERKMLSHVGRDPFQDPTIGVHDSWFHTFGGSELNVSNGLPPGDGYSLVEAVNKLDPGVRELITSPNFASNHGTPGCCDAITSLNFKIRLAQALPLALQVVNSEDKTLGQQRAALIALGGVFSSTVTEQSFVGFRRISEIRGAASEVKAVFDLDLQQGEESILLSRLPYIGINSLPQDLKTEDRYLKVFLGDMYSKALFFVALSADKRVSNMQLGAAFIDYTKILQKSSQVGLQKEGLVQFDDNMLRSFLLRSYYNNLLDQQEGAPGQRVFDALLCAWEYAYRKGYALHSPFSS
jgi:hypothetical protein